MSTYRVIATLYHDGTRIRQYSKERAKLRGALREMNTMIVTCVGVGGTATYDGLNNEYKITHPCGNVLYVHKPILVEDGES